MHVAFVLGAVSADAVCCSVAGMHASSVRSPTGIMRNMHVALLQGASQPADQKPAAAPAAKPTKPAKK